MGSNVETVNSLELVVCVVSKFPGPEDCCVPSTIKYFVVLSEFTADAQVASVEMWGPAVLKSCEQN